MTDDNKLAVKRRDGPSPWGSSYYGMFMECERKFHYRYNLMLIPRWDPVEGTVEARAERLRALLDEGQPIEVNEPPAGVGKKKRGAELDYEEEGTIVGGKPDPLRLGTIYHLFLEQWFSGVDDPIIKAADCPEGTSIEEYNEAHRLFIAYASKHGAVVQNAQGGEQGLWEVGYDGAWHFRIVGVEVTVVISGEEELHAAGLLLPLSVRYDTIIIPANQSHVMSLEHKTTYRRIDPRSKAMDLQIGMHMLVWNLTHTQRGMPPMQGVLLDQAVKGVKNPALIIPEREYFSRTAYQQAEVLWDLRCAQQKLVTLTVKSERVGMESTEAERLWERRRSACFFWNKPCPYLPICDQGRDVAGHLYEKKEPIEVAIEAIKDKEE